jgi:hypothetical protein
MARIRRTRIAAAIVSTIGLGLLGTAAPAQATQHYIAYVNYYNDAGLTQLVGSWTFNDCPGEQGAYGWGTQTDYHTIQSEPCP